MTAPDPRPYAAPTDLVTAADVSAWLVDYHGSCAAQASIDLHARLDRERRQACERGWWAHARLSQTRGRWAREARETGHAEWAALRESERAYHMTLALAFRAAARAR